MEESRKVEALSRLAGGIAHDFNNSLTVMLGNAELVKIELPQDSPANEAIDRVIEVGMGMSRMTRQLLTIGRKKPDTAQTIDVGELLTKLGSSLQRLLTSSHQLKINVDGNPRIYADPGMFERAFFNLVLNARDAMPDGGIIRVHCTTDTARGPLDQVQRVSLTIADSGIGMDQETMSQIFDPFFTTKGDAGTGLGLATLKAWLHGAGGDIRVESSPGKGSSFTLNLPAASD
jgi:two-component system cell cycle sensor histidine kinase/response regulator CckA